MDSEIRCELVERQGLKQIEMAEAEVRVAKPMGGVNRARRRKGGASSGVEKRRKLERESREKLVVKRRMEVERVQSKAENTVRKEQLRESWRDREEESEINKVRGRVRREEMSPFSSFC